MLLLLNDRSELGKQLTVCVVPAADGRLLEFGEARRRLGGQLWVLAQQMGNSVLGAAQVQLIRSEDVVNVGRSKPAAAARRQ
jgi:hypothetical protein